MSEDFVMVDANSSRSASEADSATTSERASATATPSQPRATHGSSAAPPRSRSALVEKIEKNARTRCESRLRLLAECLALALVGVVFFSVGRFSSRSCDNQTLEQFGALVVCLRLLHAVVDCRISLQARSPSTHHASRTRPILCARCKKSPFLTMQRKISCKRRFGVLLFNKVQMTSFRCVSGCRLG